METLDILGWISSALVVWSLMVARVLRFRVLNLVGAALGRFNAVKRANNKQPARCSCAPRPWLGLPAKNAISAASWSAWRGDRASTSTGPGCWRAASATASAGAAP